MTEEEQKKEVPEEQVTEAPVEESPEPVEETAPEAEETPSEEPEVPAEETVEEAPVEEPAPDPSTPLEAADQADKAVAAAEEVVAEAEEATEEENELSEEDKMLLESKGGDSAAPVDIKPVVQEEEEPEPEAEEEVAPAPTAPEEANTHIYALRTTANREDQVLAFVGSNAARKKLPVYSVIAPHGMRGYIFVEAADRISAEQSAQGVPYAKGLLPNEVDYGEIEHMLEQVKKEVNIQKNDIVEIISGPFKREKAKISRVDQAKEEAVVELLEAAVPIPITLKLDDVKVIRREEE